MVPSPLPWFCHLSNRTQRSSQLPLLSSFKMKNIQTHRVFSLPIPFFANEPHVSLFSSHWFLCLLTTEVGGVLPAARLHLHPFLWPRTCAQMLRPWSKTLSFRTHSWDAERRETNEMSPITALTYCLETLSRLQHNKMKPKGLVKLKWQITLSTELPLKIPFPYIEGER